MLKYICKRLAYAVLVLLGVSLITGSITGLVAALLFRAMKNVHLSH
jgi:ABC-type dipeptide/oligopeptide/nickel transport system permease component